MVGAKSGRKSERGPHGPGYEITDEADHFERLSTSLRHGKLDRKRLRLAPVRGGVRQKWDPFPFAAEKAEVSESEEYLQLWDQPIGSGTQSIAESSAHRPEPSPVQVGDGGANDGTQHLPDLGPGIRFGQQADRVHWKEDRNLLLIPSQSMRRLLGAFLLPQD